MTLLLLSRVVLFVEGAREAGKSPYQSWEAKVLFFKIK